jgi:hypothetical protein
VPQVYFDPFQSKWIVDKYKDFKLVPEIISKGNNMNVVNIQIEKNHELPEADQLKLEYENRIRSQILPLDLKL